MIVHSVMYKIIFFFMLSKPFTEGRRIRIILCDDDDDDDDKEEKRRMCVRNSYKKGRERIYNKKY